MTLCEQYCTEYLGKIFYYCLKKTGNENDAGDLSSEISCEILSALKNEIVSLISRTPSISRGYVVEQALADGWLTYSDDLIPTAGAYIYK